MAYSAAVPVRRGVMMTAAVRLRAVIVLNRAAAMKSGEGNVVKL